MFRYPYMMRFICFYELHVYVFCYNRLAFCLCRLLYFDVCEMTVTSFPTVPDIAPSPLLALHTFPSFVCITSLIPSLLSNQHTHVSPTLSNRLSDSEWSLCRSSTLGTGRRSTCLDRPCWRPAATKCPLPTIRRTISQVWIEYEGGGRGKGMCRSVSLLSHIFAGPPFHFPSDFIVSLYRWTATEAFQFCSYPTIQPYLLFLCYLLPFFTVSPLPYLSPLLHLFTHSLSFPRPTTSPIPILPRHARSWSCWDPRILVRCLMGEERCGVGVQMGRLPLRRCSERESESASIVKLSTDSAALISRVQHWYWECNAVINRIA